MHPNGGERSGRGLLEIRVHGIGDHGLLSALGSPPLEAVGGDGTVAAADPSLISRDNRSYIAGAPILPAHPVQLVNWSRTTRSATGRLWYLALPYTLCNMAGVMVPPAGPGKRVVRSCVGLTSATLTVLSMLWSVAIVETVLIHIPRPSTNSVLGLTLPSDRALALTAVVLPVAAFAVSMTWRRSFRDGRSRVGDAVLAAHVGLVVLTGLVLAVGTPRRWTGIGWPISDTVEPAVDVIPASAAASALLVSAMAGVLWLCQVLGRSLPLPDSGPGDDDRAPRVAANYIGAAFVLAGSIVLAHVIGGFIRAVVDGLLYLLSPVDTDHPAPGIGLLTSKDTSTLVGSSRVDAVPLFAVLAVLVVATVSAIVWRALLRPSSAVRPRRGAIDLGRTPFQRQDTDGARREGVHLLICSIGRLLTWSFWPSLVLMSVLTALIFRRSDHIMSGGTSELVSICLYLLGGLTLAFIVSGQPAPVATALAMAADVIGFWKVRFHPLAGVTYRHAVMTVLDQAIRNGGDRTIVLVGHSQGSVLCAWYIHRSAGQLDRDDRIAVDPQRDSRDLYLVTCGSPLTSLYCCFFPRYFNQAMFDEVRAHVVGWNNYWRSTDPIATRVGGQAVNVRLDDPGDAGDLVRPKSVPVDDFPPRAGVRAHGDYWIERRQFDHVARPWICVEPTTGRDRTARGVPDTIA